MGRYLTERTYAELERVIGLDEPGFTGGGIAGGASRQVCFVLITSGPGPLWKGTVTHVVGSDGSRDAGEAGSVRVREFFGKNLSVGQAYLCVATGDDADHNPCFLTSAGCDLGEAAGDGLFADPCGSEDSSGSCCPKLNILPGCHVVVNETGIHVDVDSLIGNGLEVENVECSDSGDCCPRIQVANPVCFEFLADVDVSAVCNFDGTITITTTKTFKSFRGFGVVSDGTCESSGGSS